jgi:hypothetical protein
LLSSSIKKTLGTLANFQHFCKEKVVSRGNR